jgi:hypothetical protein
MKRLLIFLLFLPIILFLMPLALSGIRRYERKLYENDKS